MRIVLFARGPEFIQPRSRKSISPIVQPARVRGCLSSKATATAILPAANAGGRVEIQGKESRNRATFAPGEGWFDRERVKAKSKIGGVGEY